MNREIDMEMDDELRPKYDFSQMKGGVEGKYVERHQAGSNLALLDPDVAQAFPTEDALNMRERIFNLFVFVESDVIYELGVVVHEREGTDKEKLTFLQSQVNTDFKKAVRVLVPDRYLLEDSSTNQTIAALRYDKFRMLMQMNLHVQIFEEIFQSLNAASTPFFCMTPVVEGQPRFDSTEEIQVFSEYAPQEVKSIEIWFSNYLDHYTSEEGFDLAQLLDDDYLLAIKLLYNNGHYVSALKLLMSFVDTVAYLEFGDTSRNFQQWIDQYADLSSVEVSAAELWEMRNSLLHMTNSDSRKVLERKVPRILFYVGTLTKGLPDRTDEAKYFNLMSLIETIMHGVNKWASSYNADPSKLKSFIDRYDRVLSDSRYQTVKIK